uniref:hypothetical protein n=1 Tax=Geobacillus sp. (strain Y412MC10) TaxID=481743 RepID=UPI0016427F97
GKEGGCCGEGIGDDEEKGKIKDDFDDEGGEGEVGGGMGGWVVRCVFDVKGWLWMVMMDVLLLKESCMLFPAICGKIRV